jgi:hypothetical protein
MYYYSKARVYAPKKYMKETLYLVVFYSLHPYTVTVMPVLMMHIA